MYSDIIIKATSKTETMSKLMEGPVGYTIARTARILNMTRQSVDKAIRKDSLHATRLYLVGKDSKKLISTEVDRDSVHAYANAKLGRNRVPFGYTDDQFQLFS